ncbi:MAG: DUF1670 domain-containing protein [Chloroflexi bacterium]|nr:DUF1670 domain-containing protein [Chloroflexota bacterium]
MNDGETTRLVAKTPQERFLQVLEREFRYPRRVAEALLAEAQACLLGTGQVAAAGQMRVILARLEARSSKALRETDLTEVIRTIDAGAEDAAVLAAHGQEGLRRVRLQRLLDEALAQDAVATLEDVARVLQVSVRTLKRDASCLRREGILLPTRGSLQGMGRGQTHKAVIVGRWLQGQTDDQLARSCRHTPSSIARYVEAFIRVVWFERQGYSREQIALLLGLGSALVDEYLAVYRQYDLPQYAERLEACLERICGPAGGQSGEGVGAGSATVQKGGPW